MTLLQLLINGIALGAAYSLVALGFVLVVNATGAVNFAKGDLVMAGGYMAVALAAVVPLPGIVLLPAVVILMFVLGVALSLVAYFPLMNRPAAAVFISTICLGIVLQNSYHLLFGPDARAGPPLIGGGVLQFGPIFVGRQALAIIATAAALIVFQYLVFSRTQLGRRLRATAQDRDMAQSLGIPVHAMIAMTFGIGASLAGVAGLLLANQFFVSPGSGVALVIAAYIAVVIGGWGSLPGAVLGAMLIAVFQVVVSAYVSYTVATAALYVAVLAILFFRPQGILGQREQRRA